MGGASSRALARPPIAGPPLAPRPRVWPVFVTYVAAVAGIFATSAVAALVLIALYPDVPETRLLRTLAGLVAGSLASSTALMLTLLLVVRPAAPADLRLVPGRENPPALAAMVVGILALGQALDSATTLAGVTSRGSMALIRQALLGVTGPELVGAVVVIGLVAGAAEEIFFRGYMQPRLGAAWRPAWAVLVTSAAFAILHVDVSGLHIALAFLLGLYLGVVAELTGSTLPPLVCHVVNNIVFTLQTALGGSVTDPVANAVATVISSAVFAAAMAWLRRSLPRVP